MATTSTSGATVLRRSMALVIGISHYSNANKLKNAENDARDMSSKLKSIGFNISEPKLNLTYDKMTDALNEFKSLIQSGDIVLFYFAGHGTQWKDQSYLIPVNDEGINCSNLKSRAINAQDELMGLSLRKPFVTIFLLDCCRTYDFYNHHLHGLSSNVDIPRSVGLAAMHSARSLIVFACAPGTIATGGEKERNGLFTKHLLKHLTPNQDIRLIVADVTKGVECESKSTQIPFLIGSLSEKEVYLCVQPSDWKTICKDHMSNADIDIPTFLKDETSVFLKTISREQLQFVPDQLLAIFKYLGNGSSVDPNGPLDRTFNTIIDQELTALILVNLINDNESLLPYIIDSLKRYHALTDIQSVLPNCVELQEKFQTRKLAEEFIDLVDTITTRTLLIIAIECLSLDSQRFLGTFIRRNDLPIPLSYYIGGTCDFSYYKINFNCLIEVLCVSTDRVYIQMGSERCIGFGKTSLIPFIFNDKRSALLFNKSEDAIYRSSCIDVMFGSVNNSSYVIFDVHGHGTDERSLALIYAIQLYATIQVLFITPDDLQGENDFLKQMIKTTTRQIPTIISIFDEKFDRETSTTTQHEQTLIKRFQTYANDNGRTENIKSIVVPTFSSTNNLNDYKIKRRAARLIPEFKKLLIELEKSMKERPLFRSIFAIQSAYIINSKNSQNTNHARSVKFEIEYQLDRLFGRLSNETENLNIVVPMSYFRSQCDLLRKRLAEIVDLIPKAKELDERLKQIKAERRNYKELNPYAAFLVKLLLNSPFICIVITERYLETWRSKYTPPIKLEKEKLKKEAFECERKLMEEEQKHPRETNSIIVKLRQQLQNVKKQINDKDAQLANVDLTIGLLTDELFLLYDYLREEKPILFQKYENNFSHVADQLAQLVYRGFAIHILRNRPLLCQSTLMEMCLKRLHVIEGGTLAVLTVIGEQSSAKSALLNTTFGCNFRVSAGRCTTGMYLGVAYYKTLTIAILDSEGLLSLEESGSIFDNQMITMAVLSSHIVLINHKGELSANLEGLIGMSLYAKLQIQSSPSKPKLMFVLRDQTDRREDIFKEQLNKLRTNLQNSSRFLGVSIDNELEMNVENLSLLPSAFSEDINPQLNLTQRWRNQTFPTQIHKLRSQIFRGLIEQTVTNNFGYKNFDYFYKKISNNWNSIDELGQGLLECKTLYELSITNELKEIAKKIIIRKSEELILKGRMTLKELMTIRLNQTQLSVDLYMKQLIKEGIQQLELLTSDIVHQANNEFQQATQQISFAPLRDNIMKHLEPSIRCNQQLLREQFEADIYSAAHERATVQVQNQLLDSAKAFFERQTRTNVDIDELNQALQLKHTELKHEFEQSLNSLRKTHDEIISTILNNYNLLVNSRRATTNTNDIYNRCPNFNMTSYYDKCAKLDDIFKLIYQNLSSQQKDGSVLRKIFKVSKPPAHDQFRGLGWFRDHHADELNRQIFRQIVESLIPELNRNLVAMLSNIKLAYSDPQTITNLVTYVDNSMNGQQSCIQKYYRSINLPQITADLIFIALRLLVNEAIRISDEKHNEMQNALGGLENWMNNIKEQFINIRDSDAQSRKFSNDFLNQLFEEIIALFKKTIHEEIEPKISGNSQIDPEKIARNAYDKSIGSNPPDGDNIIKYVFDINRYYLELALKNVQLSAQHIVGSEIGKLQKKLSDSIDIAIDVVQKHTCNNVQQVYQSIIQALKVTIPDFKTENLIGISAMIQQPDQFRQRFMKISDQRGILSERIGSQKKEFDEEAKRVCRTVITQRLGCQSCCPGCGTKCDNTEPVHDKHKSAYHITMAFKGWRCITTTYPTLELCYQQWQNNACLLVGGERFSPRRKYYEERAPQWFDDIDEKARTGDMRDMTMPPLDQRRAWMAVRGTLVNHYNILDHPSYDNQYYPTLIPSLPAGYQPQWTHLD